VRTIISGLLQERSVQEEPTYYSKRGQCYRRMRNMNEAVIDLKKALHMKPFDLEYRTSLSETLAEAGRYEEAKNGKLCPKTNLLALQSRS
jgi:tetratricopeptide (TPR) repeat protein